MLVAACDPPAPSGAMEAAPPVSSAIVQKRDVPIFLDGLGTVIALKTISIHTQVDGALLSVAFREGQSVRRGDRLAQVDDRPFRAQLQQAEGALKRDLAILADAQMNLHRDTNLRRRGLVAQEVLDDQRAQVGQAEGAIQIDRGQIAAARLNIAYARITSPLDGVTGIRLVDPGNLVHASDQNGIVVVTQLDPIAVLFTLPQDDLPNVADAMKQGPLTVELRARDGDRLLGRGKVVVVDNQINQTTATIRLKALLANPDHRLWPNQFVKAHLKLTTMRGATTVPSTAIQRGPNGTFAYVIGSDGKIAMRAVTIELKQGDLAIVKSGLSPGERVVVEGQGLLRPGTRVIVRDGGAIPDGGAR
jgi:multidrug efflux system membrane fusion protein